MLFDGNAKILDLKGKPVKLDTNSDEDATLADVASLALTSPMFNAEDKSNSSEKVKRFKLALKITDQVLPVEITIEEAALIKKCVGELPHPLLVGRVDELLEKAKSQEEKK